MRPNPPLSPYHLLACPRCKAPVTGHRQRLTCSQCAQGYPIVNQVPVMLPDGRIPEFQHQHELTVRSGYLPWIERLVMQSLPPTRSCSIAALETWPAIYPTSYEWISR